MQGVDGGSGEASVNLTEDELRQINLTKVRTMSDPGSDPVTGAELGMYEATDDDDIEDDDLSQRIASEQQSDREQQEKGRGL